MAQQLTVTLPDELADRVRELVTDGGYADESAVVADGLRALETWDPDDDDPEFDAYVRREVQLALDEIERDPSCLMTGEEVRRSLNQEQSVHEERRPFNAD